MSILVHLQVSDAKSERQSQKCIYQVFSNVFFVHHLKQITFQNSIHAFKSGWGGCWLVGWGRSLVLFIENVFLFFSWRGGGLGSWWQVVQLFKGSSLKNTENIFNYYYCVECVYLVDTYMYSQFSGSTRIKGINISIYRNTTTLETIKEDQSCQLFEINLNSVMSVLDFRTGNI